MYSEPSSSTSVDTGSTSDSPSTGSSPSKKQQSSCSLKQERPRPADPGEREGTALSTLNDHLILVGGYASGHPTLRNDVHVLDTAQRRPAWERVPFRKGAPRPRYGHAMCTIKTPLNRAGSGAKTGTGSNHPHPGVGLQEELRSAAAQSSPRMFPSSPGVPQGTAGTPRTPGVPSSPDLSRPPRSIAVSSASPKVAPVLSRAAPSARLEARGVQLGAELVESCLVTGGMLGGGYRGDLGDVFVLRGWYEWVSRREWVSERNRMSRAPPNDPRLGG